MALTGPGGTPRDEVPAIDWRRFIAIALFIVAGFVMMTTFYGKRGHVLFPSLVPIFGIEWAIAFLAFQALACLLLRSRKGYIWLGACALGGFLLVQFGHAAGVHSWRSAIELAQHWPRDAYAGAACLSGLGLGYAFWNYKA